MTDCIGLYTPFVPVYNCKEAGVLSNFLPHNRRTVADADHCWWAGSYVKNRIIVMSAFYQHVRSIQALVIGFPLTLLAVSALMHCIS